MYSMFSRKSKHCITDHVMVMVMVIFRSHPLFQQACLFMVAVVIVMVVTVIVTPVMLSPTQIPIPVVSYHPSIIAITTIRVISDVYISRTCDQGNMVITNSPSHISRLMYVHSVSRFLSRVSLSLVYIHALCFSSPGPRFSFRLPRKRRYPRFPSFARFRSVGVTRSVISRLVGVVGPERNRKSLWLLLVMMWMYIA
jgi:hypothetical protein